jgi:hypothetical protein
VAANRSAVANSVTPAYTDSVRQITSRLGARLGIGLRFSEFSLPVGLLERRRQIERLVGRGISQRVLVRLCEDAVFESNRGFLASVDLIENVEDVGAVIEDSRLDLRARQLRGDPLDPGPDLVEIRLFVVDSRRAITKGKCISDGVETPVLIVLALPDCDGDEEPPVANVRKRDCLIQPFSVGDSAVLEER